MRIDHNFSFGKKLETKIRKLVRIPALVMLVCIFACSGCNAEEKNTQRLVVVDLEAVMQKSKPAEQAREHLKQVKARLEDGLRELDKAWAKQPKAERSAVLRDGLVKLNNQMAAEEEAANAVVMQLLVEASKNWQAQNKGSIVLPSQNILAADETVDISSEIISLMAGMKAEFPALPEVNVKKPEEAKKDVRKEDKKKDKANDSDKKSEDRKKNNRQP